MAGARERKSAPDHERERRGENERGELSAHLQAVRLLRGSVGNQAGEYKREEDEPKSKQEREEPVAGEECIRHGRVSGVRHASRAPEACVACQVVFQSRSI